MTKLNLKIGDAEIAIELEGCSAEFDGTTLKIKAEAPTSNVTETHHHYYYHAAPAPAFPVVPTIPPAYPPYWPTPTITWGNGLTSEGTAKLVTQGLETATKYTPEFQ